MTVKVLKMNLFQVIFLPYIKDNISTIFKLHRPLYRGLLTSPGIKFGLIIRLTAILWLGCECLEKKPQQKPKPNPKSLVSFPIVRAEFEYQL